MRLGVTIVLVAFLCMAVMPFVGPAHQREKAAEGTEICTLNLCSAMQVIIVTGMTPCLVETPCTAPPDDLVELIVADTTWSREFIIAAANDHPPHI